MNRMRYEQELKRSRQVYREYRLLSVEGEREKRERSGNYDIEVQKTEVTFNMENNEKICIKFNAT